MVLSAYYALSIVQKLNICLPFWVESTLHQSRVYALLFLEVRLCVLLSEDVAHLSLRFSVLSEHVILIGDFNKHIVKL